MTFLAHSPNSTGTGHPLRQHLLNVGKLARTAAGTARWADEAELAGRLHDLGKYGDLFQARLRGEAAGLDHWSAGAFLAATDRSFAALGAALAIEGHHVGLQAADKSALRRLLPANLVANHPLRLRLSDPDFARLRKRAEADGVAFSTPRGYAVDHSVSPYSIARMLDVRLLFSCLVDADFLDTEAHFQADAVGKRYREAGAMLEAEGALAVLDQYLSQDVRAMSKADAAVAAVRDALWQQVTAAAGAAPGLFTLTAPTGSGKTLAMLKFALDHAHRHGLRRIVLVVPFLSIVEQTAAVYRCVFAQMTARYVLEHHSLAGLGAETSRVDAEQDAANSGERQRRLLSENWDAPIVLTTNVQLLESLFSNRPAACRKLHRLMGSVILFDEAQSLPQDLAVPTLAALSHLASEYSTSVVFATATQPAFDALDGAVKQGCSAGWRPRELVADPPAMFAALKRFHVDWIAGRERTAFTLLAQQLLRDDRPQVLCVVNLKKHARALLDEIRSARPDALQTVFHLSTNLCPAHRQVVLQDLRERLRQGRPCRLLSTQCIEAGVDVDFPAVYRALAPLEAIAQAAGRCNREGRLRQPDLGSVFVFEPDQTEDAAASARDRWRGRYPSFAYYQATELTRSMLRERGDLDLNDPALFREYYRRLFDLSQPASQNTALANAIQTMDFPEIARLYRLIDQDAIQILVPWSARRADYEDLRARAAQGIDANWMTQAQALAVAIYRPRPEHPVWAWLVPARFRRGGESEEWFVLADGHGHDSLPQWYDDTLGLQLPESQRIIIA
jgi:CRISPR-associated endonuclease Cas3-HD